MVWLLLLLCVAAPAWADFTSDQAQIVGLALLAQQRADARAGTAPPGDFPAWCADLVGLSSGPARRTRVQAAIQAFRAAQVDRKATTDVDAATRKQAAQSLIDAVDGVTVP